MQILSLNKNIKYAIILWLALYPNFTKAQNWPCFRGPDGQGIASGMKVPVLWNDSTGIAWKTDIPGHGWSSPVVWENKVFLTTVSDSGRNCRVVAFDLETGNLLWNTIAMVQEPGHLHSKNSYASSTPVTDGQLLYAVFGDGSVIALDFTGKIIWQNREIKHYCEHGLGASPILYKDLIIMPYDGSSSGPDKSLGWQVPWDQALIVAFDKYDGKIKWKAGRGKSRIAYVTPTIMSVEKSLQLISAAGDVVQGFNPDSGKIIWTVGNPGEGVVPSVVTGDGLVFVASGWGDPAIRAIRPDTTDKAVVVWEMKKDVPKIPSFLYQHPYLYTIIENGTAMCLEGKTGKVVWRVSFGGKFSASPVLAEDKMFLLNENTQTTIIESGPEFRLIAKNNLTGKCQASMAFSKGHILIRTDKQLYCIVNE